MIRILFVCLGNICRSPMAEAIFRKLIKEAGLSSQFLIASAGTAGWHAGEPPHRGTQMILRQNQVDFGDKRAQQISSLDMEHYDYIIAMDAENVADIEMMFGKRIPRLLEYAPKGSPLDVPDPYYSNNFNHVYQLVLAGCQGLLSDIRKERSL